MDCLKNQQFVEESGVQELVLVTSSSWQKEKHMAAYRPLALQCTEQVGAEAG